MTVPITDLHVPLSPREALTELLACYRDQARFLNRADLYFRAEPSSVSLGSRIPPALTRFRTPWPAVRVAVNAYVDRISLEDFSIAGDEDTTEEIRDDLGPAITMSVLEAVAVGNGFLRTIVRADGTLSFAGVQGRDGAFLEDFDTGETLATMRVHRPRRWIGPVAAPQKVTVYTPGMATTFAINKGGERIAGDAWGVVEAVSFPAAPDALLMRPVINRQRAGQEYGRSEARDLYALQDQGSRTLTNISIISDSLAIPQRVLIADEPNSFADLSQIQAYLDSVLTLAGSGVKVDSWPAAQLQPLLDGMLTLSRQAATISGIPIMYWGIASDQTGVSGDAIRENDARLVVRATNMGKQWMPVIKDTIRDASLLRNRKPGAIEVKMTDPATPTPAAAVDAAIKLSQMIPVGGQPVIDREYLWDILRTPPDTRERIRALGDAVTLAQLLGDEVSSESSAIPPGSKTNPGGPPNGPRSGNAPVGG